MRVVHVYKDIYPVVGGIENHVRLLCRELSRLPDLDIRILVTAPERESEITRLDGVQIVRAGRIATVASTPLSIRLGLELRRLRPDIIHLHFPYPVGELAAMAACPGVPTVISYHSDVVRQRALLRVYGPLLRRVLRRSARILVTSQQYLDSSPWLAPVRDRCEVQPLGIDLAPFRQLSPVGDGRTILFVGRFRYYKGLNYLLDALARLQDARLVLVGSGPEGAALHAQAQALGIDGRITWAEHVSDEQLPGYYAAADLFVLPASERSEAFGLVLVEALASGLPCISTELGTGTSYVNLHGITGLSVPPRDAEALAGACRALLADPERRRAYGAAGKKRAAELFDIGQVARRIAAIYRDVYRAR